MWQVVYFALFNSGSNLNVFPNPASNILEVRGNGFEGRNLILSFSDISGRILISQNCSIQNDAFTAVLEISKLKAGIYLLCITNEKGEKMLKKVVKE